MNGGRDLVALWSLRSDMDPSLTLRDFRERPRLPTHYLWASRAEGRPVCSSAVAAGVAGPAAASLPAFVPESVPSRCFVAVAPAEAAVDAAAGPGGLTVRAQDRRSLLPLPPAAGLNSEEYSLLPMEKPHYLLA